MKVEYFLTILTIINAGIVAYVAIMQYKLAKDKFNFDLFEKRLAIYKEVENYLKSNKDNDTWIKVLDFFYKTKDAVFLFEDDIRYYIEEIGQKANKLEDIRKANPTGPFPPEYHALKKWLIDQLAAKPSPLIVAFSPYLKFRKWK